MNTDTLEIYSDFESVRKALERGEPVVEVPEHIAKGNRAERRRYAQKLARQAKVEARSSNQ